MQAGGPQEKQRAHAQALQQANFAIQNKRPAEAERIAGDVLRAQPGYAEATKILGYALLMQGRAKEAAAALERVARSGRDPEIETQLAIALRQAGQSDKALIWLKRAVKRTPPFAAAFHELGYLLFSLQRSEEAIAALKQGIEIAPLMIEMPLQLGHVYYIGNDRANAADAFARALSINPAHSEAMHGLGMVLMDDGQFSQAADLFRRAVEANPDDANARICLGKCLLELGQADAAYACLRTATRRSPQIYAHALKMLLTSGRGRFWLRPSAVAKFFKGSTA